MRRTRKYGRRRSYRKRQNGGELRTIDDFVFVNIRDTTPELRNEFKEHMHLCWPDSNESEETYDRSVTKDRRNIMLIYKKHEGSLVFTRMITLVPEDKAINIDLTCVSPTHRGKGYYKTSLVAMRKKFDPEAFKYIQNRAEMDTIGNITHTKRLEVFHKLGYRINPLAQIGSDSFVNTQVRLKDGRIVYILQYDDSASEPSYKVLTRDLKTSTIKLSDIDRCMLPKLEATSLVFDDGSKNGKKINRGAGEKWEMTNEGIVVGEELYPWAKIRRRNVEPIAGNRFNEATFDTAYCSLIMPF